MRSRRQLWRTPTGKGRWAGSPPSLPQASVPAGSAHASGGAPKGPAANLKTGGNMPLIESEPKGRWTHLRFQIDNETKQDLLLYCKFTTSTPDWVIRGALKLLFKSDPEFMPWREQQKLATVEII